MVLFQERSYFFNIHKLQNKRGSSRIPDFTPLQMLAQLANYLQASIPAIETDLITLTRKCNNVLLNIRKAFKDELGIEHMHDGVDIAENFPRWNLDTVAKILHEDRLLMSCMQVGGYEIPIQRYTEYGTRFEQVQDCCEGYAGLSAGSQYPRFS